MPKDTLKVEAFTRTSIRRIAVQNQVLYFSREFLERRIKIESMSGSGDSHGALQETGARAGAESTFEKRLAPIHDYFCRIKIKFRAQAVTFRARSVRRIKTEGSRLQLRHRDTANRPRKLFGIDALFTANDSDGHQAAGKL